MAQPLKTRSDWLAANPPRAEQLTQTAARFFVEQVFSG
jgi:hypothetical protein